MSNGQNDSRLRVLYTLVPNGHPFMLEAIVIFLQVAVRFQPASLSEITGVDRAERSTVTCTMLSAKAVDG
jgi:hypothetical protein